MILATRNQADSSSLSSGNWARPLANLHETTSGNVARSASVSRSATCFKVDRQQAPSTCRAVVIKNHNLVSGLADTTTGEVSASASWRIRRLYNSTPAIPTRHIFLRAQPLAVLASSNLTGTAATGDPENPSGDRMTATSASTNTDLRISFQEIDAVLATGAGLQEFRLALYRTGGGGSNPTATIDLWYNGSFVANLVTATPISSTTGQLVSLTWNASLLAAGSTGTKVQLRIRGTASATATVEVGEVEFAAEITSGTGYEYSDTGWLSPALPFFRYEQNFATLYLAYVFDEAVPWDEMWIDFQDPTNADGYIDLGRLWIADDMGLLRTDSSSAGAALGIRFYGRDTSKITAGRGAEFVDRGKYRRGVTLSLNHLDEESAFRGVLDRIDRQVGLHGELLVIADENRAEWLEALAIIGRQVAAGEGVTFNGVGFDRATLQVEERS